MPAPALGVRVLQIEEFGKYLLFIHFAQSELEVAAVNPSLMNEAVFWSLMCPIPNPTSLVGRQTTFQRTRFLFVLDGSPDQWKFLMMCSIRLDTD